MSSPDCAGRSELALRMLNGSRFYQNAFYSSLLGFGLLCLVWEPSSPVSRFMPQWVHGVYLITQVVAPSMSFVGQIMQRKHLDNAEIVENGWRLQLGADVAVTLLLLVAAYSFARANDEPSVWFILPIWSLLTVLAGCLVVRDVIALVRWRRERRRHADQ